MAAQTSRPNARDGGWSLARDRTSRALARLFASHAAIALGHAYERQNLNEAIQTRKIIGEAIGILMERHKMNEDHAFAYLVRASSHANIKLRAIAQELVDERNTD